MRERFAPLFLRRKGIKGEFASYAQRALRACYPSWLMKRLGHQWRWSNEPHSTTRKRNAPGRRQANPGAQIQKADAMLSSLRAFRKCLLAFTRRTLHPRVTDTFSLQLLRTIVARPMRLEWPANATLRALRGWRVRVSTSTTSKGGGMSAGYNCCTLLGRLCAAPEELKTKLENCSSKLQLPFRFTGRPRRESAKNTRVLCRQRLFGKTAEIFLKYVQKGDTAHLVGRFDSNQWKTDDGNKRLSLSFVVEQLNLLPNERSKALPKNPRARKERTWRAR
jgi:single-stranded DNA-binding protein